MGNLLQKVLFSISTAAPVLMCTGIVVWLQESNFTFAIILMLVGIIFSLYSLLFVIICKVKVAITTASISELAPNDKWAIAYLVSYITPFASITIKDFNSVVICTIVFIIVFFLSLSNCSRPNPLLIIFGYHFYSGQHEGGTTDYCIISKRKGIHNPKSIREVYNVFDYFLIEKR